MSQVSNRGLSAVSKKISRKSNASTFANSPSSNSDDVREFLATFEELTAAAAAMAGLIAVLFPPAAPVAGVAAATLGGASVISSMAADAFDAGGSSAGGAPVVVADGTPTGPSLSVERAGLAAAIARIDSGSTVFEATVDIFADAARRMKQAVTRLQGAIDELFRPSGGRRPGASPGLETIAFPGADRRDGSGAALFRAGGDIRDFGATAESVFAGLDGAASDSLRRFGQLLERTLATGKGDWRDFARVAVGALEDILATQIAPTGTFPKAGGGGLGGILGGIARVAATLPLPFPLPFAEGGRFASGQALLVGERGPELLLPGGPGAIVPNRWLGAVPGSAAPVVIVNQSFDFRGADQGAVAALRREAGRLKREITAEIMASATRGGVFARLPRV